MGSLAHVIKRLGRAYVRRRLAHGLDGLHVGDLERARDALARGPVIFAANHVAWWDGLVAVALDDALQADSRILMRPDRLRELPFFGAFGAVPVHGAAGVRGAMRWLDRPGRAVWIFPQGAQRPAHQRPLGLRRGVQLLARSAPVIPISIDYRFREASRPAGVVRVGAPLVGADLLPRLEAALAVGLDRRDLPPALVPARPEPSGASRALAWLWRRLEDPNA